MSYSTHINRIFARTVKTDALLHRVILIGVCYIEIFRFLCKYSQLPLYRSRRYLYYSIDMTELCYNGSNISALKAPEERTHFDISGHSVITEFDIEEPIVFINLYHISSLSGLSDYFPM